MKQIEFDLQKGFNGYLTTIENDKVVVTFFEDGDILVGPFGTIFIFNGNGGYKTSLHAALFHRTGKMTYGGALNGDIIDGCRLANQEEKQRLFEAMRKDGKRWNEEKKCVEDIKYPYAVKCTVTIYEHGGITQKQFENIVSPNTKGYAEKLADAIINLFKAG